MLFVLVCPVAAVAEVELRLSTGTAHTLNAAQAALSTAFLGPQGQFGGVVLQAGQGPAYNLGQGRGFTLRFSQTVMEAAPRTRVRAGLAISRADQTFRLDQGIGIFVDPARARLKTWSLWADVEVRHDIAVRVGRARIEGDVSLGLGLVASRFKAHLTSALLDVRAEGRVRSGYVRAGIGLDLPSPWKGPARARWITSLTAFGNESFDLSTGLALSF